MRAQVYPSVNCASLSGNPMDKAAVIADVYWAYLGLSSGNTGRLGCYCRAVLSQSGTSALLADEFTVPTQAAPIALCAPWFTNYFYISVLTYGSALIIASTNVLLRWIIAMLVSFEKHTTRTSELMARALYLLVVSIVNMAIIIVLVNAYLTTDFVLLQVRACVCVTGAVLL